MQTDAASYRVKLAETEAERQAAQRLRYRVFVEEMGAAASPAQRAVRREWDAFDPYFEQLILIWDGPPDAPVADPLDRVVGVYRLMTRTAARAGRGFYGAMEYDLGLIEASPRESVELGRTCVAPEHRGGAAMHLMWNALAEYVLARDIGILFGAASFAGTDPAPYAEALSFLHHRHLAPPDLRVRAQRPRRIEMDLMPAEAIDPARALRAIPPLLKAYLRLGGVVGDGAWRDDAFNTIDVCLVMDTDRMKAQRRAFYERNRSLG
ncbi:GNAT family N-acyltransferase [Amaricoccus sp.]|uniref:GNAT family N-acetyltransferase n=1 Tax=Amaricoccus sp. TaxID=1872485 RepID=UPI001B6BC5DD|nr:GNAT family N-acyltransferase [Amaricoccus sp.]MBP7000246.1 GNAT family N-acetyltransferase [Amaricoccus sp.]